MATSGQHSQKTRDHILNAARVVLTQVGYEKITTRRIAETAGVNIAALHYHFGSKEALLSAVLQNATQQAITTLEAHVQAAQTTREAIHVLFASAWQISREQRGFLRYDVAVRGLRDDKARREATALYQAFQRLNESVLQKHVDQGGTLADGVTVGDLARYMVAATDGVLLQFALSGDEASTERGLDLIEQHVLHLLKESGAQTK